MMMMMTTMVSQDSSHQWFLRILCDLNGLWWSVLCSRSVGWRRKTGWNAVSTVRTSSTVLSIRTASTYNYGRRGSNGRIESGNILFRD